MLEKILNTFCTTIISQFKIPKKGVLMLLLIFSSIVIAINKCIFHYSIAPKGSLLLQLIYFIWMYSFASIPIRAYNEYCDKQDAKKIEEENKQKAKDKLNEYFKSFDYCDYEEKEVLIKFYYQQITSIKVDNIAIVRAMRSKGIDIFSFEGSFSNAGKALTSETGLKIINKYFDREKSAFFKLLNSLEEKELNLLKDFIEMNENEVILYKKEIKTAKSIINKFETNNFDDIYIDDENGFHIADLYFAYLTKYFQEQN